MARGKKPVVDIAAVLELTKVGLTLPEIAERLGYSYSTLHSYCSRNRVAYVRGKPGVKAGALCTTHKDKRFRGGRAANARPEWCAACRCMVYMPCQMCRLQEWKRAKK